MSRTCVVIPCYNEAQRLPVNEFADFMAGHLEVELLMVDNGSDDGTGQVLRQLCSSGTHRMLTLESNSGKAEAVRKGLLDALERGGYDYIGYWDADLATPLQAILEFQDLLEQQPDIDHVIGARVQLCGRLIERSIWRHYPGRFFATAVSMLLGFPLYDSQCGAKLLRVLPGSKQVWQEPFLSRWLFDVELLARLHRYGRRPLPECLYEYPLKVWRDKGETKMTPSDFLKAPWELLRIAVHYGLPGAMRPG